MSTRVFDAPIAVPYTASNRSHRIIALPNGLLTLLVSDPTEDLASAALCIATGAQNDPEEVPGLAHFCEHLLFLGSKNFPSTTEFHDLLSRSGGRRNAFTTGEQTCYFFEVPSDLLHEDVPVFSRLVEMFADCVKNPLFPESMFEKEVYAIDNEHNANVGNQGRVLYHAMRLISNNHHPFHRFATGNFFTLNDMPKVHKCSVREELKRYFQENYVADRMTLVVRGSQSLNQLQKLAAANFGDVKTFAQRSEKKKLFGSRDATEEVVKELKDYSVLASCSYDTTVFSEKHKCILINSSKTPTIRLLFPVRESQYTQLFETAWCDILGDESSGSLYEVLSSEGLASGVSAFSQRLACGNDVLVLEIKLTNTGFKKLAEVIGTAMHGYRSQIFGRVDELARHLFEMESVDMLSYLHQDVCKSPMEEASLYAQNLQKDLSLGALNVLKGSNNWKAPPKSGQEFWIERAKQFQHFNDTFFTLDNLRFVLMADSKINTSLSTLLTIEDSGTDQFFNFEYTRAKFDPFKHQDLQFTFHFVPNNPFIPTFAQDHQRLQFLLEKSSNKALNASLSCATKSTWSATKAQLVSSTNQFELWTKPESLQVFHSKCYLSFDIISCSMDASPLNTMNCEVLVELLKLKVASLLYPSELLNYTWEANASIKGDVRFGFTVSGFTEGVPHLLNILVHAFKSLVADTEFNSDGFRRARVAVRSRYSDLVQDSSLGLALTGLLVVLEENVWGMEDRLNVLDDIDTSSFKAFLNDFYSGSKFLRMIVHGDLRFVDKLSITINKIAHHLDSKKVSSHLEPSTVLIKPGKLYSITRKGPESDPMSSVCFFIQTGARSDPKAKALTALFAYLLSLSVVPDLRFKKQLGYVVLGGVRTLRTTIGLHITVMSATLSPSYLRGKIDDYLSSWADELQNLDEKEFQADVIQSFLNTMGKNLHNSGGPESLTSEMKPSVGSSNCTDMGDSMKLHKSVRDAIFHDDYDPFEESKCVNCIESLTKSQFLEFFNLTINPKSNKRASISVNIPCSLSPEETRLQMMRLQLEALLKMNGLRVSSDKLKEIVDKSGGSSVYLLKDLFKFFVGQGESLRLCSVVLREVVKQLSKSLKHRGDQGGVAAADVSEKIMDIVSFQRSNTVLRASSAHPV